MPGRGLQLAGYRFGFQNQEEDAEFWGGAVSYKHRIEDKRVGRFFSVDPLAREYAYWSPYVFIGNMVIMYRELEGLEPTAGEENYGKNVMLVFAKNGFLQSNLTEEEPRDFNNSNWVGRNVGILQNSFEYFQEIKRNQVGLRGQYSGIENLVIISHGISIPKTNRVIGLDVGGGKDIQETDLDLFFEIRESGGIAAFKQGRLFNFDFEGWATSIYPEIQALEELLKTVNKGGNVCFLACNLGNNQELLGKLSRLNPRVNLIASLDVNTVAGAGTPEDPFEVLYDPNGQADNFIIIGTKTRGKIKSVSELDNAKGTRLIINANGEPFLFEKPE